MLLDKEINELARELADVLIDEAGHKEKHDARKELLEKVSQSSLQIIFTRILMNTK